MCGRLCRVCPTRLREVSYVRPKRWPMFSIREIPDHRNMAWVDADEGPQRRGRRVAIGPLHAKAPEVQYPTPRGPATGRVARREEWGSFASIASRDHEFAAVKHD